MFEVLITLLFVPIVVLFEPFWWRVSAGLIWLVLVAPGFYAIIVGAPFLPSHKRRIDAMIELSNPGSADVVVDLGCGDGRVIRAFADRGVKNVVGYEFSLPTWLFAKVLCFNSSAKVRFSDFWGQDFSDVDVIVCFLMGNAMNRFEKEIWPKLRRGTRVVSNDFEMRGVKPITMKSRVFLYVKK